MRKVKKIIWAAWCVFCDFGPVQVVIKVLALVLLELCKIVRCVLRMPQHVLAAAVSCINYAMDVLVDVIVER